jgi:hypothetical protein
MQRARGIQFDPEVVDVILQLTQVETPRVVKLQPVSTDLAPGMVLGKDFTTPRGGVAGGRSKLTQGLIDRIRRYEQSEGGPWTWPCARRPEPAPFS